MWIIYVKRGVIAIVDILKTNNTLIKGDVDSLGLFVLKGADVQVHYHEIDGNAIASYVYQIVAYQLQNDFVIASNETIDGIDENGNIQRMIQWTCQYEQSLVQPIREVLDICPGSYAAGNRDHS